MRQACRREVCRLWSPIRSDCCVECCDANLIPLQQFVLEDFGSSEEMIQVVGMDLPHLLLAGSLVHGGRRLTPYASIYVGSDEPAIELAAGPDGAAVLMLRFPRRPDA